MRGTWLLTVTLAFCVQGQGQSIPVTFTETEFSLSDWSLHVVEWGSGGSASVTRVLGPTSHYRLVEHVVNNPESEFYTQMAAFHFSPRFVWVPARMGGIQSLDYSVDYQTPETAVGLGLALRQGTNIVWGGYGGTEISPEIWNTQTANLGPDSFPGIDSSEAGAPIELGLITANSTTADSTGYRTCIGLDNFSVTVVPRPPRLRISWSASEVTLSWPGAMTNYVLQSSAQLGANAVWQPVSGSPVPSGDKQTVRSSTAETAQFYRLRSLEH